MIRSLTSGISGLKNHQTRMDVIANNIANVNTTGFKSSRVNFQDIFSQTIKPASEPTTVSGGTNPQQIGLGVSVASTDMNFTQGPIQSTGEPLDLALDGDGFFVVSDGSGTYYTRAGNFKIDADENIVNPNGLYLMSDGDTPINTLGYKDIKIDAYGKVTGLDSSGDRQEIATIAIATFPNNAGLEKLGGNIYRETQNSGAPTIESAEDNGQVQVKSSALEASNVDLATEFTEMIITQRGFQANPLLPVVFY
jgi:flagellar hook protein FlgE